MNIFKYLFQKDPDALMQKEVQLKWMKPQMQHMATFGEEDIQIGDRFMGYGCGNLFQEQICTRIDEDGTIYGTTTLTVFDKKYIKKY